MVNPKLIELHTQFKPTKRKQPQTRMKQNIISLMLQKLHGGKQYD